MMSRIVLALLIGAIALAPALSVAEDEPSLERAVVEMADTPAEHTALARYYSAKAEEARAEAQRHERMGGVYVRSKSQQRNTMQTHCKNLAQKYSTVAEEYEALAKLHEAEAKQ